MYSLIIGLLILIICGIIEYRRNSFYRKKVPVIIHINGTRGKSSVTRLIAAGLRAGGKRTIAKTTGSAPRLIFENGEETPIIRHHGANIKEQLKIIKFAAEKKTEILVLECMAVTPEYQWVTEQKVVRSNIGVITNSRLDHLDLMGPGIRNVTLSLCNTLPPNRIAFTSEKKMFPLMKKQAEISKTKLILSDEQSISDDNMKGFGYIEHKENIALSLDVCEHLGIDRNIALKGMYEANPDIGASEIFFTRFEGKMIYFSHSFAANDPESTEFLIKYIKELHPHIKSTIIVLSTRADRMFRSKQLIKMLLNIDYDKILLIGEQTNTITAYASKHNIPFNKILNCGWTTGKQLLNITSNVAAKEIMVFGIGNIGGNGGIIVDHFRKINIKRQI
ncbi:MAG: poly-gamma-glutamate synthase PgsB [Candidatus Cloacimonetes bacterium]|nr:poly-gamma-glutamate synthase PgsB [Candidatus Cloacimonadota bacterium]